MTTDLTTTAASELGEQMRFAEAVAGGDARNSLLPQAYRGNPANVLIAVGLGSAMGLSYAESLYRIDVIQGTPAASAELIAQNVRKAGHKLRIRVTEEPPSATVTITRADDPDEPLTITRDMAWAKKMGLDKKDNYLKQPATMLSWRAITACARLACSEALYGVAYTADEIDVVPSHVVTTPTVSAADFTTPAPAEDVQDAEEIHEPQKMTARTRGQLFALMSEQGWDDDTQRAWLTEGLGRTVESRASLTEDEALQAITVLRAPKQPEATS